jgi:hypothetical protein
MIIQKPGKVTNSLLGDIPDVFLRAMARIAFCKTGSASEPTMWLCNESQRKA